MKKYLFTAIIILFCFSQVAAGSGSEEARIEINLPSRTLSLYIEGELMKEYPVCVGSQSTPTPQGEYRIVYKTVDPYWINKEVIVPPGPENPLGKRWLGLTKSIGIHGNNRPMSIGTYESAGCIRMYNRDVEELYNIVPVNTPVIIKYDRIKLFEDKYTGKKAVVVYPDIYKKGNKNNGLLLDKLAEQGLPENIIKKTAELLTKPGTSPRSASGSIGIFLNGSLITCDSLEDRGELYIECKAAEDILGLTAGIAKQLDIGIKEVEQSIYVNLSQAVSAFGGALRYDPDEAAAYISMKIIKINGAFAGLNHGDYDRTDFLAAEALKQLEYDYSEDSVDVRLFGKGIMKLKRNKVWSVNVDSMLEALEGKKNVDSCRGIVDLSLPTYVRFHQEYLRTEIVDGELALNAEAASYIKAVTNQEEQAFAAGENETGKAVRLESFLENFEYSSNNLRTVIDIRDTETAELMEH